MPRTSLFWSPASPKRPPSKALPGPGASGDRQPGSHPARGGSQGPTLAVGRLRAPAAGGQAGLALRLRRRGCGGPRPAPRPALPAARPRAAPPAAGSGAHLAGGPQARAGRPRAGGPVPWRLAPEAPRGLAGPLDFGRRRGLSRDGS